MSSARKRTTKTTPPPLTPKRDEHVARALRYIDNVLTGKVPVCKYVKQACRRQLNDLENFDNHKLFYFDEDKAGKVCRFIELLPHIKGPAAFTRPDGKPNTIHLEDWQCFILTTVFGWRRKDTGGRRFRRAYVEVPRGNAKSTLSSGIGIYGLTSDGEEGAEIYSVATTREQATIVYGDSRSMLRKRPDFTLKLGVIVNDHVILKPTSNSRFTPLSREAKSLDGKNVHIAIIDELHAHATRDAYDVIETATSKRFASLVWMITTAGSDSSGICYEVRSYTTRILDDIIHDEAAFGIIYTVDENDDWQDPLVWQKCNPNWGVSVMPDSFANLAVKAMQLPAAQSSFKTKHLNIWVNADQAWMDMRAWDRCADLTLNEIDFKNDECFIGLDLASKTDIAAKAKLYKRMLDADKCLNCERTLADHAETAKKSDSVDVDVTLPAATPIEQASQGKSKAPACKNYTITREPHYYLFVTCYLPEQAVEDGRNASYAGWEIEGWLKKTPGDVLDFGLVKQDLVHDRETAKVRELGYDPWQAAQLAQEMQKEGFSADPTDDGPKIVEVRATVANFSAPMKELDAIARSGHLHHDGSPIMRWMVSCVVCHTDAKDNIYPRKEPRPENKIDGVVASIIAMSRAMLFLDDSGPYSASRGFRML